MTIDDVIYTYLSTHAGLAPLTGNRIYPDEAEQGVVVPFIVRTLIDQDRESGFGGDMGLVHARHQFDVYAATNISRTAVMTALLAALQRWASPSTTPRVQDTFIENLQTQRDQDTQLYRGTVDVVIHHTE